MTLKELAQLEGRVYVHISTGELGRRFMEQAERDGFTFQDGVSPTKREAAEIMALNPDMTLNYVGAVGRMAFGAAAVVGEKRLIWVKYSESGSGMIITP